MFLLVGGDSEIGAATARRMAELGIDHAATTRRRELVGPHRPLLDLVASLDDWRPPLGTRAACVFAGLPRLAACAEDPAASTRVNVTQTVALADRLLAHDVHVLFLSTNQVFDGALPHVLADTPHSPVSEYGRQKARTEAALMSRIDTGAPVAVLRLAKVVSPGMALVRGWTESLRQGKAIRAFHDMKFAPSPTSLVSDVIIAMLRNPTAGIFQFTGPRDVSYAETARYLADRLGADPGLIEESSALDNGQPIGATPRHTTLDSSVIRDRFGIECPDAWTVIDAIRG